LEVIVPDLPSGTVTFLFTDIEGSTRLLQRLGQDYGGVLGEHRRLLRRTWSAYSGDEIDAHGDAFLVVFRRAQDAAQAAVAAQRALADESWPEGSDLRVRMGIHTAEPSLSNEGYLGLGVHRAARICAAAHGGQILASQATEALLADEQLDGLEMRDLGRHLLKDFDRPARLFQLVAPGLVPSFPRRERSRANRMKPCHLPSVSRSSRLPPNRWAVRGRFRARARSRPRSR
jgi:class 3 adenylate cyclase